MCFDGYSWARTTIYTMMYMYMRETLLEQGVGFKGNHLHMRLIHERLTIAEKGW
jgi:hypothetical protein